MAQSVRIQVVDRSLRVVRHYILSSDYTTHESLQSLEPGINTSCMVCHKSPRSEERNEQEDLGSDCTALSDLTGLGVFLFLELPAGNGRLI